MTNEEQKLLYRIDQRVETLGEEFQTMKEFLTTKVMTRDECQLTRKVPKPLAVIKEASFIMAMIGILWAVVKHG